jgi:ABC-type nitrate/sulfonate/bicarbonate transport system substrate-binding protein
VGEGPKVSRELAGAGVIFAARRDFADANPQLMAAFTAAMTDAMTWARDPANFEELINIYKTHINFGDLPGADELRRSWVKTAIAAYSPDLKVSRKGLKAALDFGLEVKTLERPIELDKVIWDKAPTME